MPIRVESNVYSSRPVRSLLHQEGVGEEGKAPRDVGFGSGMGVDHTKVDAVGHAPSLTVVGGRRGWVPAPEPGASLPCELRVSVVRGGGRQTQSQ